MEPQIIFEDEDLAVLNKPSGMTVNKADTTRHEITLQDWAEKNITYQQATGKYYEDFAYEDPSITFTNRAGIVHRLDKETSGILLIAKNIQSFVNLQKQFKERMVKKSYTALAHGKLVPEGGEIVAPIGRQEWNRKRFGVVAGGREAVTMYNTISNFKFQTSNASKNGEIVSLLELNPKTGRTHQIRVHLKYLNHPIFADELYAGRKTAREDRKYLSRLFLHASKISFIHPTSGQEVTFQSQLPQDLEQFVKSQLETV